MSLTLSFSLFIFDFVALSRIFSHVYLVAHRCHFRSQLLASFSVGFGFWFGSLVFGCLSLFGFAGRTSAPTKRAILRKGVMLNRPVFTTQRTTLIEYLITVLEK